MTTRIVKLFALFALGLSCSGQVVTVIGTNLTSTGAANTAAMTIVSKSAPIVVAGGMGTKKDVVVIPATNGAYSVSLLPSDYEASVGSLKWRFTVTNGATSLLMTDIITSNAYYAESITGPPFAITNGTDVHLTDLSDGQVLLWEAINNRWINGDVATGGGTGDVTTAQLHAQGLIQTNDTTTRIAAHGVSQTNDTTARLAAQGVVITNTFETQAASDVRGVAITNAYAAALAAQGVAQTNDTIARVAAVGGGLPSGIAGAQVVYNAAGTAVSTNSRFFFPGYSYSGKVRVGSFGDSLSAGGGGTLPTNSPIGQFFHNYAPTNFIYATNAGVAGQTMATTLAHYTADMGTWKASGGTNMLSLLIASVNDFAGGALASNVWVSTSNLCVSNHLDGNQVVVFEVNPYANEDSAVMPEMIRYNRLVEKNCGVWDWLLIVQNCLPPPGNSTVYVDHIHPGASGNDLIAFQLSLLLQSGQYSGYPLIPMAQIPSTFSGSSTGPINRGQSATLFLQDNSVPGIRFLITGDTSASAGITSDSSGDLIFYNKDSGGNFTGRGGTTSFAILTGNSSVTVGENWNFLSAGRNILTNGVEVPVRSAPLTTSFQGMTLGSDGTNLIFVLQNAGGVKTTNKVTFTAWP